MRGARAQDWMNPMVALAEKTHIAPEIKEVLLLAKQAILECLPNATVLLYGSVARGTQGPESDIDLLVLTNRSLTSKEQSAVRRRLYQIELDYGPVICTVFYAQEEWDSGFTRVTPFRNEVDRDAVLL